MPKLKTHKGAAKRFKKTGTGKIKRHHAFARHILTSKSRSRKRKLGQGVMADDSQQSGNPSNASVLSIKYETRSRSIGCASVDSAPHVPVPPFMKFPKEKKRAESKTWNQAPR